MQKLTLDSFTKEDNCIVQTFSCDFTVQCAGDSLWGDTKGRKVRVTEICVVINAFEDTMHTEVNVTHDSTWDIYTDTGFAAAISAALGIKIEFTEQGMQEDERASMEA